MKLLLITPPLVNLSSPYPAVLYLANYLRHRGREVTTIDLGLELVLRLFSRQGIRQLTEAVTNCGHESGLLRSFVAQGEAVAQVVDTAIACLQGSDPSASLRGSRPGYFPRLQQNAREHARALASEVHAAQSRLGPLTEWQQRRLTEAADVLGNRFGSVGVVDKARYAASRFVDELAAVVGALAPGFDLHAYGERLRPDFETFAEMRAQLERSPSVVDLLIDEVTTLALAGERPDVVGITVPFMGTLEGALRVARSIKIHAGIPVVMGGGLVNTTMRSISDPGIFEYVDYLILDNGERPLELLLEALEAGRTGPLLRTFRLSGDRVEFVSDAADDDPQAVYGAGDYSTTILSRYPQYAPAVVSSNPVVGGLWPKATMAHGCYWRRCTFCDVQLDYIGRYAPQSVETLLEHVHRTVAHAGISGIHFVDEAMPPALMRRFAEALVRGQTAISWWGNVRFDATLASLAPLLARSGCVRLTGGLETASERLLQVVDKGVTLRQAAEVGRALAEAGISVHAYLIYGYPTQTAQETVDSLEFVRQMFEASYLTSAYWHRFSLTAYSPIYRDPDRFGITIPPRRTNPFMNYVVPFEEPGGLRHELFTDGLNRSLAAYQQGVGLDRALQEWFPFEIPAPTLPPGYVVEITGRNR